MPESRWTLPEISVCQRESPIKGSVPSRKLRGAFLEHLAKRHHKYRAEDVYKRVKVKCWKPVVTATAVLVVLQLIRAAVSVTPSKILLIVVATSNPTAPKSLLKFTTPLASPAPKRSAGFTLCW